MFVKMSSCASQQWKAEGKLAWHSENAQDRMALVRLGGAQKAVFVTSVTCAAAFNSLHGLSIALEVV